MKIFKLVFKVIAFLSLLNPFSALSNIYYLPHIHTSSDTWETYLIIDRPYDSKYSQYQLVLFSESGSEITRINGTFTDNTIKISLRSYGGSSGILILKENTSRVRLSYIATDSSGGGTAEFTARTELSSYIMFNLSNYYEQLNWSGFALFNGSDKTVEVSAVAYKNGQSVSSKSFTMPAHSKKVNYFEDFFELNSFRDIDYVLFYTNSKALTGIVISGKDNDKLLFSQGKEIDIFSPFSHMEVFGTGTIQKEIIPSTQLFTYLKTGEGAFLKPISGNEFDNLQIGGGEINAFSFTTNETRGDIFISGTNNNNKFVIKKINSQGSLLWEKEVGNCAGQIEFEQNRDLNNIPISIADNGNIITAFYDYELQQTVVKTLKQDDGSVLNTFTLSYDNCMVYKSLFDYYDNTILFAMGYTEGGKYRISLLKINNDGSLNQEYSSESPVDSDNKNVFFDCTFYDGHSQICMVLGVKLSESNIGNNYYLYVLTLSTSDYDFSKAGIFPLKDIFLEEGSKVYTGYTDYYGPNLLTLITSPYNDFKPSVKINLTMSNNHTINGIRSITYFPYKITGVYFYQNPYLQIYITSNTRKYIIPEDNYYIEYLEKILTGLE